MNFIEEFKKGQAGGNKGLSLGEGLNNINRAINGVQRGRIYGIAGASKSGKSTFTDYGFVIKPYLEAVAKNLSLEIIYFSFEIDRVSKEFDFASHFLFFDYGIKNITLPEGITKAGKNTVPLTSDYLRGRLLDDNDKIIPVKEIVLEKLKEVYEKRIIPLFGEYSVSGKQIKKGYITFIENKDNPTGLRNWLFAHANKYGEFVREGGKTNKRITGYKSKNPNKYTIIVTDHLRKLLPEKGFQKKQIVDKYIEYSVEFRNWCGWTFAHIIHLNRSMTDVQRQKQFGDQLFPSSDDIKDTGETKHNYVFICFIASNIVYLMKIKI